MDRTRIVAALRIVLPLIALGLLSSLFLLARTVDPDDALPYATFDVSERARDQQLTKPRVAGVTSAGTPYRLTSDAARPDPERPQRLSADRTFLVLDGAAGRAAVRADGTIVDTGDRTVTMEGDVRLGTADGYDLRTQRMEGSLERLDLRAPGRVEGDGPLGRLRAGAMRLTETPRGQRLLFTDGVELLYLPLSTPPLPPPPSASERP
ncbi:hypothetical protein JQC91_04840 [Jannaschia sp. Os4]|uniref:LPS export ABC transporter periplasmic protein LptC n=1 Tax=Jannaschia sp. Os4 TaxID=2807617 RepID=UPI0019395F2E|nr:LPS export ABC transporter periplasmic protein LptC [Jannaschia sp. Os4]MBM2575625.1 hypothetical protein [Jannaschia sp. Os4]